MSKFGGIPVTEGSKSRFGGVPVGQTQEKKTLTQAVFPRASEADNFGSRVVGGMLDMTSLPGRFAASGGMTPMGPNLDNMAQVEGQGSGVSGFVDNMARDPALIPSMAVGGPVMNAAGKMGITGLRALGAMGAAEGLTSAGIHQTDRALQGKQLQPGIAALEAAGSTIAPFIPTMVNKGIGRLASGLAGPSEEALRTYGLGFGKGAKKLAENAGKQNEIGLNLVDAIDNAHDFMPEKKVVDDALKGMPEVNIAKTVQLLQDQVDKLKNPVAGAAPFAEEKAAIRALEEDIKALRGSSTRFPKTKYPAEGVRDLRKRLDATASFTDDKATSIVNQARIRARTQLKNDLIEAAKASGNPQYVDAMETWSKHISDVDEIKGILGGNGTTRQQRAESFIANLHGKNKTERQKLVGKLGGLFGQDFLEKAKFAKLAEELEPSTALRASDGKPGWLPTQTTGKALVAPSVAASGFSLFLKTGDPKYLAMTAAGSLGSPRVAAGTLGTLDALQTIPGAPVRAGLRSLGQRK